MAICKARRDSELRMGGLWDLVTALDDKPAVVSGPNPEDLRNSTRGRCRGFTAAFGELTEHVFSIWPV